MPVINRNGWTRKMAPLFVVSGMILFFIFGFYNFTGWVKAANSPAIITYQGKVLINGVPATTTQSIIFVLYDAASAGTALYSASGTVGTPLAVSTTPNQGLFSVDLGDTGTNALDQTIFRDNNALYLEVRIGGETLTPRKRITAAPFAFNSRYLDGVAPSTTAASTYIPISDSSGNFNFNNITTTGAFFTRATSTNFNSANAIFTGATTTNLYASGISNLLNITGNANLTSITSTNANFTLITGNGNFTNVTSTNLAITGLTSFGVVTFTNATGTNLNVSTALTFGSATGTNFNSTNATFTSVTSTNFNTDLLSINGNATFYGSLMVSGTTAGTPGSGAGTRLMWIPNKAAFRAGAVSSTEWDAANIGEYSAAFGASTTVSGVASFAAGVQNTVTGTATAVFGDQNQVGGHYSLVAGQNNIVNADASYAFAAGGANYVNNSGAVAMGLFSTSTGGTSFAMGYYAQALGDQNIAMGSNVTANGGVGAVAMGNSTLSTGKASFAAGKSTQATGNYSAAFGSSTIASGIGSFAAGVYVQATGNYSSALGGSTIASGEASIAAGAYVTASNTSSVALGAYSTSSAFASFAMGYYSQASANYAVAFGSSTLVSGKASFGAGAHNTVTGTRSAVFGDQNQVGADYALVVGQGNIVNADADWSFAAGGVNFVNNSGAVAMGYYSTSSGGASFAMGNYAQALEDQNIAMGSNVTANGGTGAVAMGYFTTSTGDASFAAGYQAQATGNYSTALGRATTASGANAFAAGQTNVASGESSAALGYLNQATGNYSSVLAYGSVASGLYAMVGGGYQNTASGISSFASGQQNTASGHYAVAFGSSTLASGQSSFAAGSYALASGYASLAIGQSVTSSGNNAAVLGFNTTASGNVAVALGAYALASGDGSVAAGQFAQAIGNYSLAAGGYNAQGRGNYSIALGDNAIGWATSSVAIGSYTQSSANQAVAIGHFVKAVGAGGWVLGRGVDADNPLTNTTTNSLLIGFNSTAPTLFVGPGVTESTAGNVGIGTTTPATMLDVNGASTFRGAMRVAANASFDTITSGTWSGNIIDVAKGGLGGNVTAVGAGEILYSTGATAYDSLAAGTEGYLLYSNGATAPSWVSSTSLPYVSSANSYVTLQASSPGVIEIGNIDISGYGIFGGIKIGTNAVPSESLDILGNVRISTSGVYKIGVNTVVRASTTISSYFFGGSAGNATVTGIDNTGVGASALAAVAAGAGNTAVGNMALALNTDGQYNTAMGEYSLPANTLGLRNVALGAFSLYTNSTGTDNIALGYESMLSNSTGTKNIAIGTQAGFYASGTGNIFLGYQAGYNEAGSNKLYIDNSNTANPLIWGDFNTNAVNVNGNLGIGTTTPSELLEVSGSDGTGLGVNAQIFNRDNTDYSFSLLKLQSGTANVAGGQMVGSHIASLSFGIVSGLTFAPLGTTQDIGFTTGNEYSLGAASGPRVIIKANGLVGVNTNTPMGLFSIQATTTNNTALAIVSPGGTSTFYVSNAGNVGIGTATTSLERLRIKSPGTSEVALSVYESSDDGNRIVVLSEATGGGGQLDLRDGSGNLKVSLQGGSSSYITGNNVGIGISNPLNAFSVYSANVNTPGAAMALFQVSTTSVSADLTALKAQATYRNGHGTGAEIYGGYVGAYIRANSTGDDAGTTHYGVDVLASGSTGANYALIATADGTGGTEAFGISASAIGATTNWAGYFSSGNVYMNGQVGIGTTTFSGASYKLLVDAGGSGNAGVGVNGYIKATGAITPSTALDAAETYPIDPACSAAGTCPQAQDVVCLADSSAVSFYIEKCDDSNGGRPLGIVSTNPGLILGGSDLGESGIYASSSQRLVALAGRIPTRVSAENGSIARGDKLTYSGTPGVAVKAITEGPTVGVALEDFGGVGVGSIEVFVELNWNNILYRGLTLDANNKTITAGSVTEPYEFKLNGNFTMVSTTINKLSFNTTTLFESSVASGNSHAFIFNASNASTSDAGAVLVSVRAGNTPVFSVQGNGDVHALGNLYAQSAVIGTPGTPGDLAERVDVSPSDNPEPGDVMIIDENNPDTYRVSSAAYEQAVAGVISTNPTIVVGNGKTSQTAVLAMVGRVPVKVSAENGAIARGDLLVSSPLKGYAMKYDSTQDNDLKMVGVVGVALENLPAGTGKIMALVRAGWVYNKNQTIAALKQNVQEVAAAQGITLGGSGNLNVSNSGAGGKWEIDAEGRFITRLNTSEGEKAMYAIQSPSSEFIFSGSGNLTGGLAKVEFDTSTREIIDAVAPIKVNLTETSLETKGLVVIEKTATGFTVKEKENGVSNAGFDWLVVARRRADSTAATPPTDSTDSSNPPVSVESSLPISNIPTTTPETTPTTTPVATSNEMPAPTEPAPASVTAAPDSGVAMPAPTEPPPAETVATP